jgi:hypothetical protein
LLPALGQQGALGRHPLLKGFNPLEQGLEQIEVAPAHGADQGLLGDFADAVGAVQFT